MTDAPEDWGTTDVVFNTETQILGTRIIPPGKYRSVKIEAPYSSMGTLIFDGNLEVQHLNIAAETSLLARVSSLLGLSGQTRVSGDISIGHIHVCPTGTLCASGGLAVNRIYIDKFDADGGVELASGIYARSGSMIDKLNISGMFQSSPTACTVNNHTGQPIVYF